MKAVLFDLFLLQFCDVLFCHLFWGNPPHVNMFDSTEEPSGASDGCLLPVLFCSVLLAFPISDPSLLCFNL